MKTDSSVCTIQCLWCLIATTVVGLVELTGVGNVTLHIGAIYIYRGDLHIGVNWNTIHALNSPAVTQIKS